MSINNKYQIINVKTEAEQSVRDAENIQKISTARDAEIIDSEAYDYLVSLYADGMHWYREVFYNLGLYLDEPKTPTYKYDLKTGDASRDPVQIGEINPGGSYLVHHIFKLNPFRNQFIEFDGYKTFQEVSGAVSVIVAAQKSVDRSIEKIITKYYDWYIRDIISVVRSWAERDLDSELLNDMCSKIEQKLKLKYMSNATSWVLNIVLPYIQHGAGDLEQRLNFILKPYQHLRDVYRIKCLFDLVPQIRAFLGSIKERHPNKILFHKDSFYYPDNKRNYRDAKVILNIGNPDGHVVPFEMLCQVRSFYEFESASHSGYQDVRSCKTINIENATRDDVLAYHCSGVSKYNQLVKDCMNNLYDRVGWNVLYERLGEHPRELLSGFPKLPEKNQYYPAEMIGVILNKVEKNIQNEIFKMDDAARDLKISELSEVFDYLTRFIIESAMPYYDPSMEAVGTDANKKTTDQLFDFVMAELYRYHKNSLPFDLYKTKEV